ncbi:MAG: hypothetical protein ACI845_000248 [Gammaproteobacteria bacterium]|jgi:hypothetical protein
MEIQFIKKQRRQFAVAEPAKANRFVMVAIRKADLPKPNQ